ncbi:anti-sigma factor family protein [Bacteroidota bacterium]
MHCKEVEKQLSAYLDQELDQQMTRKVEEHLASCSDCKKTLSRLENYLSLAKKVNSVEAPAWLEERILEQTVEKDSDSRFPFRVPVKIIAIRTAALAAAVLILAFFIVPPRYYESQKITSSYSYKMEKMGKGSGKGQKSTATEDPQLLLFTEIIDGLKGKITDEDLDRHTGNANSITFKITKKRYPAFYQKMKEIGMDEQFPKNLNWTFNPYVTIQVSFPASTHR